MAKKAAPLILLGLLVGTIGCGKGSLTVTVLDPASTVLSGANVTLLPQGASGVTDFTGQAKLNDLDKGQAVVLAEKAGYLTRAMTTKVESNSSVTIQLSSAKTAVKVYQGNTVGNPFTVTVPEATLSGKVVVQCYELWSTDSSGRQQWYELPWTYAIAGVTYEDRAYVGEGFVTFEKYRVDALTLASGNALGGSYKIVITIPPSGAPRGDTAWYGSTGK